MEVSVVAELTVMSMERFLQETEESFSQETNHIKQLNEFLMSLYMLKLNTRATGLNQSIHSMMPRICLSKKRKSA